MEPTEFNFGTISEADPRRLTREMSGLLSITAVKDGDDPPILFYKQGGRTYVVEVRLWDVSGSPFYTARGFVERLNALREAVPMWKELLFSGEKPRSLRRAEKLKATTERETRRRAPARTRKNAESESEASDQ